MTVSSKASAVPPGSPSPGHLAAVVLAAGAGSRLAPLTRLRPKALCPVAGRALVDHALDRVATVVSDPTAVAVNLHHGAEALHAHLPAGLHRSLEMPVALGTAGALGLLRPWTGGRDVLVTNADAWLAGPLDLGDFVAEWDRTRVRLLCVEVGVPADFGTLRYAGVALLPHHLVDRLRPEPSGLYEVMWRDEAAAGRLDLVVHPGKFVDCGTPARYLSANLMASGGDSVIDPTAVIGSGAVVERCVVWDHSTVAPGEHLVDAVRAGPLTVLVRHHPT